MRDANEVIKGIIGLKHRFYECVRQELKDVIHPEQLPIMAILRDGSELSQTDVVKKMGVSAASVAVSVSRLEKLGYVEREKNSRNQRANVLRLTPEGIRRSELALKTLCSVAGAAFDGFSPEELETLSVYVGRITDNLTAFSDKRA